MAREDWKATPDWLLLVKDGNVIARHIVEHAQAVPQLVRLEDATSLVQSLAWPAGAALLNPLHVEGLE